MEAVAKNLKLDAALGISICNEWLIAFPVSFVSACANAVKFDSMPSAILLRIKKRCSCGHAAHVGKAAFAAWTALSKSFLLLLGIFEMINPVAGFTLSKYAESAGAQYDPLIKFSINCMDSKDS